MAKAPTKSKAKSSAPVKALKAKPARKAVKARS